MTRREYPERPLVGVGALVVRGDEVLLVRRANEPGKGLWSIPGGLQDVGETLEEAARREIREETGIDVEIGDLIEVRDLIVRDRSGKVKFHYVLVDFLARPMGGEISASSDVLEVRWVKIDEVKRYPMTETTRRLIEKLKSKGLFRG